VLVTKKGRMDCDEGALNIKAYSIHSSSKSEFMYGEHTSE
jgi:hypothetical protein